MVKVNWAKFLFFVSVIVAAVVVGLTSAMSQSVANLVSPHVGEILVVLVSFVCATGAVIAILTMRALGPYVPELLIIIVGLVTGLIGAVALTDKAVAVIAAVLAFLLSAATFGLKREIAERVAAVSQLRVAQAKIYNRRWRDDADEMIQDLEMELTQWANGQRMISPERSIKYQIDLLRTASRSVDAIHLALDEDALLLWKNESGKFSALIEAHERIPASVDKRRILILDDNNPSIVTKLDSGLRILSELGVRVCERQVNPAPDGLGVELRVFWVSHRSRVESEFPRDLLLVDRAEAVVVIPRGEQSYETHAFVESTPVRRHLQRFELYWSLATPAEHVLKASRASLGAKNPSTSVDHGNKGE